MMRGVGGSRATWAIVAAVVLIAAVGGAVWLGSRDDADDTAASTTTTATPSTTATTEPSTTTSTAPAPDTSTAVWPWAERDLRYDDPVAAARGFVEELVGFRDPIMGEFQAGDSRSGEVEVRASERGAVTTVLVRQLGADDHWWVLGSSSPNIVLEQPGAGDLIASPVTVAGRSRAFEAQVDVAVRADGADEPIGNGFVMGSGSADLAGFRGEIEFSTPRAPLGALILSTTSAEDGRVWEASVVRVRFSSCVPPSRGEAEPGEMTVEVYFTCEDDGIPSTPIPLVRAVPHSTARLQATLDALLAGPTAAEEDAGFTSWFSDATADLLRGVDLDPDGTATVDFDAALATTIPNASASAGSQVLLSQLDATVFGVGGVRRVEYRLGGSCDDFFEWLQSECEVRTLSAGG